MKIHLRYAYMCWEPKGLITGWHILLSCKSSNYITYGPVVLKSYPNKNCSKWLSNLISATLFSTPCRHIHVLYKTLYSNLHGVPAPVAVLLVLGESPHDEVALECFWTQQVDLFVGLLGASFYCVCESGDGTDSQFRCTNYTYIQKIFVSET